MARKNPFTRVMVDRRIYAAVVKALEVEFKDAIRRPSINAYCEDILWKFCQGKLVAKSAEPAVSQPTLQALFAKEPKNLTEEEVETILELGRRAQQKFDSEEEQSRIRKKRSA